MPKEISPVRIGLMSFAHGHQGSYAWAIKQIPGVEIGGIADENKERGMEMAKRFETTYFESYEELLRQDIHGVIVCSENIYHKDLTVMAAEAGKHVMCEKPLATTVADGMEMIRECKKHGVKLQTAFPCRFSPAMIQARDGVLKGKIGKVLAMKGTNHGMCPNGWFVDPSLSGGGAVMDHTVHVVDLMRWTLRAEVTEVYAEIGNLMLHKNIDDTGIITMKFDNGVFATLDASWSRPSSYPFWGDVTLSITGTEGSYYVDEFGQVINLYNDRTMHHSREHWGDNIDLGLVTSFVTAIAKDLPVEITGEDGLAAAAVALAAYQSAERGRPVKVEDVGYKTV